MSVHAATGLSIVASFPVWLAGGTRTQFEWMTDNIDAYTHEIMADGGYWSARISLAADRQLAELWLDRIGADLIVANEGGVTVWEGFVNTIRVNFGTSQIARGPLMEVANRVTGRGQAPSYSFAGGITVGGDQYITAILDDTDSQAKYGVRRAEISVGTADEALEADLVVSTWMAENVNPKTTHVITLGGSSDKITIELECLGYAHLLDYMPAFTASDGTLNLSAKIIEIVGLDPNSLLTDGAITTNTTQVNQYYLGDQTALSMIKALLSRGDASFNRYLWGVYAGRVHNYIQLPATVAYVHQLSDAASGIVYKDSDIMVKPWNILPGRWLQTTDVFLGKLDSSSGFSTVLEQLRNNPQMMMIERVNYTAPYGLQLSGGRTDKASQMIARLGVGPL